MEKANLKKEIAEQELVVLQKMNAINNRNVEQANAELDAEKAKLEVKNAQQQLAQKQADLARMEANQAGVEEGKTRAGRLGQWTLPEQRAIERNIARTDNQRAGVISRDWAREKFGKRIDDLNAGEKAQMAQFKAGVKGEGGWEKDIADTKTAIEELRDIQKKFTAKVGIK